MALTFRHQTAEQFAARFWTRVDNLHNKAKQGDLEAAARRDFLVWRIWKWIQDGELTNNAVRLSFNSFFTRSLTLAQWNTFVSTKLVPMKDRHLASLAEGDF